MFLSENQENFPVILIKVTPGVGKTHITEQILSESTHRVQFALPTPPRAIEESLAFMSRFHILASVTQGRNELNCKQFVIVDKIQRKGGSPGLSLCRNCEHRESCNESGYYSQFPSMERINFAPYEQVFELHDKLNPDVIVIDEYPERAFLKKHLIHSVKNHLSFPPLVQRFIDAMNLLLTNSSVHRNHILRSLFNICIDKANMIPSLPWENDVKLTFSNLPEVGTLIRDMYNRIGDIDILPSRYLADIADELYQMNETQNENNRLVLVNGTLIYRETRVFPHNVPIIVLDAYARPEIYQILFPNRTIELHEVIAECHWDILQIRLNTSKYKLYAMNTETLEKFIQNVLKKECKTGDTVIFSYKDMEGWIEESFNVKTGHLWAGRGTNEYNDYQNLILIAGGAPNANELFDDCRALWHDDPIAIDATPHPKDKRHYQDDRMELMRKIRQDDELTQVAHRIRPVRASADNPKKLILVHTMLIDGLVPDEIKEAKSYLMEMTNRKESLQELIEICVNELGFWHDSMLESFRNIESSGTCTASGFGQMSNKTYILIRRMTKASRDKGLSLLDNLDYPEKILDDKNGYRKDRTEIINLLQLPKHWITLRENEKNRSYLIYGNPDKARISLAQ